jgi:hypothetical protein
MTRAARSFVALLAATVLGALPGATRGGWAQVVIPELPSAAKPEVTFPTGPEAEDIAGALMTHGWERERLQDLVGKHKDLPPADVILYDWFGKSQQGFLARMALERAVVTDPQDPEAFVIMGNLALQEKRTTEAELLFLKAQQLLEGFDRS